jgi:hypothetical protein
MAKQYNLSREMYRGIKKMDATEMGTFLGNVFQEGFDAALKNTDNITITDLHNAIGTVKGIGDKRMAEIDVAIKKLFNERRNNNG